MIQIKNDQLTNYLHSDVIDRKKNESVTDNYFDYSSPLSAIEINVGNTKRGYVAIPLGYLYAGTSVTMSAEFMNISGEKARISLDEIPNNNSLEPSNIVYKSSVGINSFNTNRLIATIPKDGYYWVTYGVWLTHISNFFVRNVYIDVDIPIDIKPYFSQRKKTIKMGVFEMRNGSFVYLPNFSDDKFTIYINPQDSTGYTVDFERPFTHNFMRGVVIASNDYYTVGNRYEIVTSSPKRTGFNFKIYDKTTNEFTTTVPELATFSFVFFGYEA